MNILHWLSQLTVVFVQAGMPLVFCYHLICGNIFLNTVAEDATGLEKIADEALTPVHYLLAGHVARPSDLEGLSYEFHQRYDYTQFFSLKTAASILSFPFSLVGGGCLKAISYLSPEVRHRHQQILQSLASRQVLPNGDYYRSLGMKVTDLSSLAPLEVVQHARRPGDENTLSIEKEALREIVRILKENNIPFWADCGTCLGAYRYGGIIPWDFDIDLAILQPDFDNVKRALNGLDKDKYDVQDWSGRTRPKSYLKVYVKETGALIDIYHFRIEPQQKIIASVFSNEESIFMPESWKIRERRYGVPTPFDVVFPLKMANFDGVELPVPNQTKLYLQARYGEDIGPAKIYNEKTGQYEKDLTHPYWQRLYEKG